MCPTTIALIAVGAQAGGSILKGLSSAGQANYEAQVARNNAIIEQGNASRSAAAGAVQTEATGLKARAQLAGTRAAMAANNVDVNSGSPAAVQESQRILGANAQELTANRAAESVYGYETAAVSDQAQAKLDQSQVAPDILGGVLGAVGDVAGAASSLPGGGGGGSGGGLSTDSFQANPSLDTAWQGGMTSLVSPQSANPVPEDYAWMTGG